MREIKFRGKDLSNNWRYGDLIQKSSSSPYIKYIKEKESICYQIIPETVGQFTGLRDKNGKEIYEGDIIQTGNYCGDNEIGIVKYGKYNCSCCEGVYGYYVDDGDIRGAEKCLVVIGNIHDNPELLKEESK